ncbi:MAG: amino acid permease [Rickettsiaceae bacterium]|nr:amino acid permease [Rickettsiaceae bacterium]
MSFFTKKSFESVKEAFNTSGLAKNLTAIDLILLGLGGIIGTGVFALTGIVAAQYSGPAVTLSFAIAGLTCIFVALSYTELATMLPTSGSIYTYSYVAFGQVAAWLVGGLIVIEFGIAASAVASSWSAYVQGVLQAAGCGLPEYLVKPPHEGGVMNLPALLIIFAIGFMLYRGTTESKKLNSILVLIKIAAIFIFIFLAAPHFDATNWENFMPYGFDDVLRGASILFFAFGGFGVLASTAEECKNPKKDLTIGIIGSLIGATLVYIAVAVALTGVVPFEDLNTAQPLAYALHLVGSDIGSALVATGAIAGMATVIMINLYGLSRIFYAMARDGLLPKSLARLHHKYDSPYFSLLFFSVSLGLLAAFAPLQLLAKLSSMAALTDYILITIIVMLFRFKYPNAERTFKCPVIFLIAPIALLASLYLLSRQIIDKDGSMLLTGKLFISWFVVVFAIYCIKLVFFKNKETA